MSEYYCHKCGIDLGYLGNERTSSLLGSTYQLDKFMKHHTPSPIYEINSVFDNNSTGEYEKYVVDAINSGSVEIDDQNRKNIVYVAGRKVGDMFKNGVFQYPVDGIKVVCSTNPLRAHSFPLGSTTLSTAFCKHCGIPVTT